MSKNHGKNSKKAGRVARAKARQEAWEKLSPEERQAKKEENKLRYDSDKKLA